VIRRHKPTTTTCSAPASQENQIVGWPESRRQEKEREENGEDPPHQRYGGEPPDALIMSRNDWMFSASVIWTLLVGGVLIYMVFAF
jgi:hypothetical protein